MLPPFHLDEASLVIPVGVKLDDRSVRLVQPLAMFVAIFRGERLVTALTPGVRDARLWGRAAVVVGHSEVIANLDR